MLSPNLRQLLIEQVSAESFKTLFLSKAAAAVRQSTGELRHLLRDDPHLEVYEQATKTKNITSVRLRLSSDQLLKLLPVDRSLLNRVYGEAMVTVRLTEMQVAGQVHQEGKEIRAGQGHLGTPSGRRAERSPIIGDPLPAASIPEQGLSEQEVLLLNALEDIEARRINFGLYETYTTPDEMAAEPAFKAKYGDAAIPGLLEGLIAKRYVMKVDDQHYRSRISELARVLKNVKQRFNANDAESAPYLVQSLQVRFQDRAQVRRKTAFQDVLREFSFRNAHPSSRKAVNVLGLAFSNIWRRPVSEINITGIQAKALSSIGEAYLKQQGGGFVITGNTGSGKTEAALLPLLLGMLEENIRDDRRGVKALLVYPRVNLAKNQLSRLCAYVAHVNRAMRSDAGQGLGMRPLSIGILFQSTPASVADLKGTQNHQDQRYRSKKWQPADRGGQFEVPYFTSATDQPVLADVQETGRCVLTSDGGFDQPGGWSLETFQATRESLLTSPPDILIITTEMLHRWLMDKRALGVFGLPGHWRDRPQFHPPRAVVMDEIHLYSGIHGAQIAALMRRLRHRLVQAMRTYNKTAGASEKTWTYPLMLGMSATIAQPVSFWSTLTGLQEFRIQPVEPDPSQDLDPAQGRDYYFFVRPETFSRGKLVGDASAAIQTIMAVSHNMMRRSGQDGKAPKHRSLIFQDSISKLKKLTVEFRDAEMNNQLARLRLQRPTQDALKSQAFLDGEYWYFDDLDAAQYSEHRAQAGEPAVTLTSSDTPVYSDSGQDAGTLNRDIIFATTSLEVGYDDPSIQFVMQHHAPSNVASFVQKKGRAGRDLTDRPITVITLSKTSFRDAFYYQNPELLTDPKDYSPPLNAENDFVQRFHAIALLMDELTHRTGQSWQRIPEGKTLQEHLQAMHMELLRLGSFMSRAYEEVIAEELRRQPDYQSWERLWAWFEGSLLDPEVVHRSQTCRDLLELCPDLPENLFSNVNLPVVSVGIAPESGNQFKFVKEDIALVFSELSPGRVSRRYGRSHFLHWRPMTMQFNGRTVPNVVALEPYRVNRQPAGPFKPEKIQDLRSASELGENFEKYVPRGVRRVYPEGTPSRFYRLRYFELWGFGKLNPDDPKRQVYAPNFTSLGRMKADGSVELKRPNSPTFEVEKERLFAAGWRYISAESTSVPLSFSAVVPLGPVRTRVTLPPLFGGLLSPLEYFYAKSDEGEPSRLRAWELQYGSEVTTILLKRHAQDQQAGRGHNLVQYASQQDGRPLLYGYDLKTEGLRVPYDPQLLTEVAKAVFARVRENPRLLKHLQDQYLRYLLKSEPWAEGIEGGLNLFGVRRFADVLCTMRAEARARDPQAPGFLAQLRTTDGWSVAVADARRYWADHRIITDDFSQQAWTTLQDDRAFSNVQACFSRIQQGPSVEAYLRDVLIHSLKHGMKNMFMLQSSADSTQLGSAAQLSITHGRSPDDHAFYVYERNQDGAGATRAAALAMTRLVGGVYPRARHVTDWWRHTLECAVADEESLIKSVLAPARRGPVMDAVEDLLATPVQHRRDHRLRQALIAATDGTLKDERKLGGLAALLTSELRLLGQSFQLARLRLELLDLEADLAHRFGRVPVPQELSGYALAQLRVGRPLPGLARLLALYEQHTETFLVHEDSEEGDAGTATDRFLAQVEAWSLSTCVDGCPACLANACAQGPMDVMRHSISRPLLKEAHEVLSAPFTVRGEALDVPALVPLAQANGGYLIHEHHGNLSEHLVRAFELAGFEMQDRMFDPEHLLLRTVLYLPENP